MNKVYLVGTQGPEHNIVYYVCENYKDAKICWNEIRKDLIMKIKESLKWAKKEGYGEEMYERMLENLSETDPDEIDNYPQDTPYISERMITTTIEVEEETADILEELSKQSGKPTEEILKEGVELLKEKVEK